MIRRHLETLKDGYEPCPTPEDKQRHYGIGELIERDDGTIIYNDADLIMILKKNTEQGE